MSRSAMLALTCSALLASSALAGEPRDQWLRSLDDALAVAKTQNKPIFLVFR